MKHTQAVRGADGAGDTGPVRGGQCTGSEMCWVPIRLRNTQYVQLW